MTDARSPSANHLIEGSWVTLERSVEIDGGEILLVATLTSMASDPVAVRVIDELPVSWNVRTIGVHPSYEPASFDADRRRIAFETVVEPDESSVVVYGVRILTRGDVTPLGRPIIDREKVLRRETPASDTGTSTAGTESTGPSPHEADEEFIWSSVASTTSWDDGGLSEAPPVPTTSEWVWQVDETAEESADTHHEDLTRLFESADTARSKAPAGNQPAAATGDGGIAIDRLTEHPCIGPKTAEALRGAGYETTEDLSRASEADLAAIDGIGRILAADIVSSLGPETARPPSSESIFAESDGDDTLSEVETPPSEGPLEPPPPDSGVEDQPPITDADEASPEDIAETSNLLLLARGDETLDGCGELLGLQGDTDDDMIFVSFVESAEDRLRVLSGLPAGDRNVDLFCMGDQVQANTADTSTVQTPHGEAAVTVISDASDLFRLGVHLSRALEEASGEPVLCVHSLTSLVALVDLQRVFRFLHVLSGRVKAVGGRSHYHLDPDAVDDRTYATLQPLFDLILRYEDGRYLHE